ncbi:MAG: hypothetical protein DRH70_06355 [Candidatus Coatesbacteria bacterium]|nr:MAG: hypothetical protein DRH70_06355 [Candidatus Coatesbacteria bacterium]
MPLACDRCGAEIESESSAYHVVIRIYAGVPDTLPWVSPDECEAEIDSLVDSLEGVDPELIERDVHLEMSFVLCRRCKEIFAADPLNLPLDSSGGTIPDSI